MVGPKSLVESVDSWITGIWRELAKFGIVGLSALVIDIGLFNFLRFSGGEGPMYDRPISSKIVSVAVATTFAYFGNRYWTFRKRGRTNMGREYLMFLVSMQLQCLLQLGACGLAITSWVGIVHWLTTSALTW